MFERDDWTLFRTLDTIPQKAGVPLRRLARLAIKELADNALDTGAQCSVGAMPDGGFYVEDDGDGIPGSGEDIARLFSIRRPLTSSKMLRLPTRGALGNGLRVVVGAVLSSGGALVVETRGQRHVLTPNYDGSTSVLSQPAPHRTCGTRVEILLGPSVPTNNHADVLFWARLASSFAKFGKGYSGKTSAWWYSSDSFYELCQAGGGMTVRLLLRNFRDVPADNGIEAYADQVASALSREATNDLLVRLRANVAYPTPKMLGQIGRDALPGYGYACERGLIEVGSAGTLAYLPYCIEVFAKPLEDGKDDEVQVLVNRTPITGEMSLHRQKKTDLAIIGCGLRHLFTVGRRPLAMFINVSTPYMPITTDGKEPDLKRYYDPLSIALGKAARSAKKFAPSGAKQHSQKDVILGVLDEAIEKASGGGQYRYSLRQLFYAVRPALLETHGKEPGYDYFAQVITDYEAATERDLPGLYRDARGVLYHPHTGEEIPLGTLNVEKYSRPDWTFNKVLYSEKEGFFSILKDVAWPERNDCALLTSKGFASRAARDVIDLIGGTQEEIFFFCIHDSDAAGTMIYQALQGATTARERRKVHIINLGLDPEEALEMGLQVETFRDDVKRRLPVADYLSNHWRNWLQTQRVELNAMTSPQFLEWLDAKMEPYVGKIVPPTPVLQQTLEDRTEQAVRRMLAEKILNAAGFEDQVRGLVQDLQGEMGQVDLDGFVRKQLNRDARHRWDNPVEQIAATLAARRIA